jgi:hypothetical protein
MTAGQFRRLVLSFRDSEERAIEQEDADVVVRKQRVCTAI